MGGPDRCIGGRVAYCQRLIAAVLAALFAYTPSAWAFYASASTPAGFSGSAGNWLYAAKRTDQIINGIVRQAAASSVNVGGQSVRMAAAYRYGAAAGRVAAGVLFSHPALAIGTAVGIAAWIAAANVQWDVGTSQWVKHQPATGCVPPPGYDSTLLGCGGYTTPGWTFTYLGFTVNPYTGRCYASWSGVHTSGTTSVASCAQFDPTAQTETVPLTSQSQFETAMAPYPMPDTVPQELPEGTPLPIEGDPVLNPSPGTSPQPQPMRVPTGDPVPTVNPGEWRQPYTDIVPSPAPSTPWRVDVKPGDIIQTTPTPMPDPQLVDPLAPPPPGTTVTPRTEDQLDLCQKYPNSAMCQPPVEAPKVKDPIDLCLEHPDIVACEKLGDVPPVEPVVNENKEITLMPDAGWGSAGVCPPPRQITLAGGMSFQIPLDLICDFARMIRPLVVAMAYLGAAMMLVGAARRE